MHSAEHMKGDNTLGLSRLEIIRINELVRVHL